MKCMGFFSVCMAILLFAGCASVPKDSVFLINNLDNEEKSNVITEKGIKLYKSELEGQENYQKLPEIKEYFVVALRFNPENEKAEEFLGKIENFFVSKVEEKIALAEKLLKKGKRSEKEEFTLAYAVRKAFELDPKNSDVLRLKKETLSLTNDLTERYLERAGSDLAGIKDEDNPLEKSKKYISAYDNCRNVLLLDPENKKAQSDRRVIETELDTIMKGLLKAAKDTLSKNDFKGTSSSLKPCYEINKKMDAKYRDDIAALSYELNYKWAHALLAKKDYKNAEAKIKAALRVKNTSEALELKKKITLLKRENEFARSFKKWMDEIDSLIAKKNLKAAYDKIQSVLGKTKDKNYIKQLKTREGKIKNELSGMYDKAIKFYKQENFKEAINLLKIIVHIDPRYEKAGDYLEKAESRQKLLDSY